MGDNKQAAAAVVAHELIQRAPCDRARFLVEMIAHAAEGLKIIDGNERTAERLYALADSIVAKGEDGS